MVEERVEKLGETAVIPRPSISLNRFIVDIDINDFKRGLQFAPIDETKIQQPILKKIRVSKNTP
jgi:hypothetical protein